MRTCRAPSRDCGNGRRAPRRAVARRSVGRADGGGSLRCRSTSTAGSPTSTSEGDAHAEELASGATFSDPASAISSKARTIHDLRRPRRPPRGGARLRAVGRAAGGSTTRSASSSPSSKSCTLDVDSAADPPPPAARLARRRGCAWARRWRRRWTRRKRRPRFTRRWSPSAPSARRSSTTTLFEDEAGNAKLREWQRFAVVRPPPRGLSGFMHKLRPGTMCELWHDGGWWEVAVIDRKKGSGGRLALEVESPLYNEVKAREGGLARCCGRAGRGRPAPEGRGRGRAVGPPASIGSRWRRLRFTLRGARRPRARPRRPPDRDPLSADRAAAFEARRRRRAPKAAAAARR